MPCVGATSVETAPPMTDPDDRPSLVPTVVIMAATVAVFGLIAVLRSQQVDVPFRDPSGKMFARKLLGALWFFVGLSILDVAIRWWSTGQQTGGRRDRAALRAVVRQRWAPSRLALVGAGLLAYHLVYICYRNLKSWLVFRPVNDDWMLRLDRDLFFGHSPGTVLHDVFGTDAAAHPLAFFYKIFTYVCLVAIVGCMAFLDDIRKAYVMVIAGMWAWILGTASYYLIPTLGPVFSAPQEFAMLPHTAVTDMVSGNIADRAHMIADPHAPDAFVGVAAFASLHVGFTATIVLTMAYLRKRLLTWVTGLYLIPVVIATVYFGWHFVIDLAGGVLLAVMSVAIAHASVYRRLRRPA